MQKPYLPRVVETTNREWHLQQATTIRNAHFIAIFSYGSLCGYHWNKYEQNKFKQCENGSN